MMSSGQNAIRDPDRASKAAWRSIVEKCQQPSVTRALWQLVNTLIPYALLWYLMYRTLEVSLWLTIPLAVLAGAFLVRVFIIFHDCGHGSYFKSRRANDIVGFLAGVLTFTPYYHWRWEHAIHHGTAGHLDKRGTGDVWTMTVQEYLESSRWRRFAYQLARNPLVLFVLAPLFIFVIRQRFASSRASRRERRSVWLMNLALLCVAALLSWIFGIEAYLLVQLTAMTVAGAAGVWLFYVQHQFEDVYWERGENWNYTAAALQGSSFYKLPRGSAVVLREYRVSPHPSFEPTDSQLQSSEVSRERSSVSAGQADYPRIQPEVPEVSAVGRRRQEVGWLRSYEET
jgi:acyl-lipid omega-6 desaturase (Delta-12 desaturase)